MHNVFTTDSFILDSREIGESNKFYRIFTKDLGLINATAQGVRGVKSKLKFALQDFSFAKISFVNGRDVWRITNAVPNENIFKVLLGDREKLIVFSNITSLVKKIVSGEERNKPLFDAICSSLSFLSRKNFVRKYIKEVECITVLRALHYLGHLGNSDSFGVFLSPSDWSIETLIKAKNQRAEIVKWINKSLKEM